MSETTEIKWEKPCGCKVVTNVEEATIKAAVELGWEQVDEQVDEKTPVKKTVKK